MRANFIDQNNLKVTNNSGIERIHSVFHFSSDKLIDRNSAHLFPFVADGGTFSVSLTDTKDGRLLTPVITLWQREEDKEDGIGAFAVLVDKGYFGNDHTMICVEKDPVYLYEIIESLRDSTPSEEEAS